MIRSKKTQLLNQEKNQKAGDSRRLFDDKGIGLARKVKTLPNMSKSPNNLIISRPNCQVDPPLLVLSEISRHQSENLESSAHKIVNLFCSKCGYFYPVTMRCGDRTCPECRLKDYYRLLGSYRSFLMSKQRLRLITLTLRGRPLVLTKSRLNRLRKCFLTLIHQKFYKSVLTGGFYSIEAKKSYKNNPAGWNVHIHILAEGGFINQKRLSNDWFKITGDSYIVDIRSAFSGVGGFKYVLKYLTKSPMTLNCDVEYNSAFAGSRLVSVFGNWYGKIPLLKEKVICPKCGNKFWLSEWDLRRLENRSFKMGLSPPLDNKNLTI